MKNNSRNQLFPATLNGLMENLFSGNFPAHFDDHFQKEWSTGKPAVNITESDTGYELSVVAPGASREDFKMNVNDKVLSISFEKKESHKEEGKKWLREEYSTRSFKRSFTLGDLVDVDMISAKYDAGILKVNLPKKETAIAANKEIEIS